MEAVPLIFNVPYVALRKDRVLGVGVVEPLARVHWGCHQAFTKGESYVADGDRYVLDFFPFVLERTVFKSAGCVFHLRGLLLVGIDQRYHVGYFTDAKEGGQITKVP